MKVVFTFLFFSLVAAAQVVKKPAVQNVPAKVNANKPNVVLSKSSKDVLKSKTDLKKTTLTTLAKKPTTAAEIDNKLKLNDSIVTITKKEISEAPIEEQNLSYDVAFRLLNSCNTSKLKKFTDLELTQKLLDKITLSYISAICVNNNEEYGKFIGLELIEVLTNENIKTNIYRYKIEYERKLLKKEIRIYINKDGLVSVIKTCKWKDKFELKKKPKPRPRPKKVAVDSLTIIDESFIIRN